MLQSPLLVQLKVNPLSSSRSRLYSRKEREPCLTLCSFSLVKLWHDGLHTSTNVFQNYTEIMFSLFLMPYFYKLIFLCASLPNQFSVDRVNPRYVIYLKNYEHLVDAGNLLFLNSLFVKTLIFTEVSTRAEAFSRTKMIARACDFRRIIKMLRTLSWLSLFLQTAIKILFLT